MVMNITFLSGSYPVMPCGVGDYTYNLVKSLSKLDKTNVTVITSKQARPYVDTNISIMMMPSWSIINMHRLVKYILISKPDILHIQYPAKGYGKGLSANLIPLVIKILNSNLPIVVTIHEFHVAHLVRKLSMFFLLFYAKAIIISDINEYHSLNKLLLWRKQSNKIVTIPLAPNIPLKSKHIPKRDIDIAMLCYFGFLSKTKNIKFLFAVLSKLFIEGLPFKFLFIGGFSQNDRAYIQELGKKHHILNLISFSGYRSCEDVSRLLAGCDIALFPFCDGVTLRRASLIAAMQHGLPVVTTGAKGQIPSGLSHGDNIMLSEVDDVDGFTKSIREIVNDYNLRIKISNNAKKWSEPFNWNNVSALHIELYNSLTRG
jgi:glycosyltransferase involved in cell wall biosynthesis